MALQIRAFEPEDLPAWTTLWEGYLAFYRVALASEITETTWARLLDPSVDIHGLAAVEGGTGAIVGIVHYLFHPVTWSASDRCYLEDLFVAKAARGSGAGRALIAAVYRAADARDADQVYWLTEDDNLAARRLYDRVGHHTRFIKYRR
ncbi:MAG: GNAT family N-acetyltransferase [Polyangiales bacterium]